MFRTGIPFIRILLPFCGGIVSGLYIEPGPGIILTALMITVSAIIFTFRYNRRPVNYYYSIPLFASLFLAGLALYSAEKNSISDLEPVKALFTGKVCDFPVEKANSWLLSVSLDKSLAGDEVRNVRGSVLLYLAKGDSTAFRLRPGDDILFYARPVELVNRNNPCEFDYRFYMERKHTRYYAFVTGQEIISVTRPSLRNARAVALILREKMISIYRHRGISGDNLAIIAAITLGERDLLEPELKQEFIKAGIIHVMAVSGLHIGILSLFIYSILFFLGHRLRILRVILVILILWCFAFITGMTPSVMRATLMFSLIQAGHIMKRDVNNINLVLASAFIILLLRPSTLFDSGFLLSYSAVIPIIAYYKGLYNKLSFKYRIPDRIWQVVCVTLLAQAGTFPLTVMLFNRFPSYFLLTNLLIVPVASLVVMAGCLVWITFPLGPVSGIVTIMLDRLSGIILFLTSHAASLPDSTIENIGMTIPECILLIVSILTTIHFIVNRDSISIRWPVLFFIVFFTVKSISLITLENSNELIVYNSNNNTTAGIRYGRRLEIFTNLDSLPGEVTRHASAAGLRTVYNYLDASPLYVRTRDANILICRDLQDYKFTNDTTDFFIITGTRPLPPSLPGHSGFKKQHFIFSEASAYAFPGRAYSTESEDDIWIVRKSGAYRKLFGLNRKIKVRKNLSIN